MNRAARGDSEMLLRLLVREQREREDHVPDPPARVRRSRLRVGHVDRPVVRRERAPEPVRVLAAVLPSEVEEPGWASTSDQFPAALTSVASDTSDWS